ncbi:MAG: preprotein translocase subunit SecE [Gammaproteobacteria bacterium]|nr:preprotein translocase subunit SecE [Gammaproteobacteria bacterium]
MADKIKLILAVLVLGAAIGAFYYYADHSMLVRVLVILVALGISTAIALQTGSGQKVLGFVRESQVEVRKVVWPTRKETLQTTLVVMAVVVLVAIFLWLLDMLLLWAVRLLTGQGG